MSRAAFILEGCSIRLESLTSAHADAILGAAADGDMWRNEFTVIPGPDSASAYIEAALQEANAGTVLPMTIILKAPGRVVGCTRFFGINRPMRSCEIGYTWIAKSYQGTVVNAEAKYLMLKHAFEKMECIRVQFRADARNSQSRRALEKLGATFEGIVRSDVIAANGYRRDSALYSILDTEWGRTKSALEARMAEFGVSSGRLMRRCNDER